MTLKQAEFLKKVTDDQMNQECEIRDSYSGRGMFGRSTVGIVIDSLPQLLTDVLNYVNDNVFDGEPNQTWEGAEPTVFSSFCTDSMGMSIIVY